MTERAMDGQHGLQPDRGGNGRLYGDQLPANAEDYGSTHFDVEI